MKNKYVISFLLLILLLVIMGGTFFFLFQRFFLFPKEKKESADAPYAYSYRELEQMEEINIQEDKICIVLYENQAIPYRWSGKIQSDYGEQVYEATIDGNGNWNAVGDSPAYHIFVYEMREDGNAEIEIRLARIDDSTEISNKKEYLVIREHNRVTCEEVSLDED